MDIFIYVMGIAAITFMVVYGIAAALVFWAFHSAFSPRRKS